MRLLIIGGGRFLGRTFAEEALSAGHDVTVFNRGKTSADLAGVTVVRGDRGNPDDVARLSQTGTWDAVIDTCDSPPRVIGESARALAERAGSYLFVSSISAFADSPTRPVTTGSALHEGSPDATEGHYGALKAGGERAVRDAFPERALILYPGLIVGPYEDKGRQTWWLSRIARGGDVLAPGEPDRPIRLIDARDLAQFGLSCLAAGRHGEFAVTSPPGHVTFGSWLAACADATGGNARLVWAPDTVLLDAGVAEWTGLPLWTNPEGDAGAVWDVDVSATVEAGLRCRPIRETTADTWRWLRDSPVVTEPGPAAPINGHGLPEEEERRILAALAPR